jgi:hypothetical protein
MGERSAPVRTLLFDETETPLPVLEQNQVFSKQPHPPGPGIFHFGGRPDRLPIPAHQIAHGGSGGNLCQKFVLLGSQHLYVSPNELIDLQAANALGARVI